VMTGASFGLIYSTSTPLLALLMFAAGAGWGYMPVTQAIPYERPGLESRGVAIALSIQTAMLFMGGIIGPVVAGAISEATGSLRVALLFGALTPLALAVTALPLSKRRTAAVA
jgi:MFS family permease